MDETEQKILNAAIKVFASEGYGGATTQRIAEVAGVNEVTLFRKFQSKENILRAVITRNREIILKILDSVLQIEKEEDIETSLRTLGRGLLKVMRERVNIMVILIAEGRRNPEVAVILESVIKMVVARISEYFEYQMKNGKMRIINSRTAALTFLSYICHMSQLRGVISEDILGNDEEEFDGFVDIFIKGILNAEEKK
ncbi:MAG: TetR/AcrR family transcriptional regulator [Candidatus Methanoperedens sp.]|nr:TetR/AcrR family transcriptional regulator [Candidatus Methanoperedens sp.]